MQPSIDILPAGHTAANPPHAAAAVDRYNTIQYNTKFVKRHVAVASEALAGTNRRTDRQTPYCNIDPADHQRSSTTAHTITTIEVHITRFLSAKPAKALISVRFIQFLLGSVEDVKLSHNDRATYYASSVSKQK